MKLSVDRTKNRGFRIKSGSNVFLCEPAGVSADHAALEPMELLIASLGSSLTSAATAFCEQRGLSSEGLKVALEWEFHAEDNRLARINVSVHMPNSIASEMEDEFISVIHTCDVYKTLMNKPEIHCHTTSEVEKPEGESLVHFVGAE